MPKTKSKNRKVMITCAVTGAIHTPSMSPHLPITADEIADAALGAHEAGAALVFLTCMKELPATLLLAPTEFSTLATRVWTASNEASASPRIAALMSPAMTFSLGPLAGDHGLSVRSQRTSGLIS